MENKKKNTTRTFSTNPQIDAMITELMAAKKAKSVSELIRFAIKEKHEAMVQEDAKKAADLVSAI